MENGSVMGLVALVISVVGTVIGVINHKRIRSSCCGRKLETSLDIENTTPTIKPIVPVEQPTPIEKKPEPTVECRQESSP